MSSWTWCIGALGICCRGLRQRCVTALLKRLHGEGAPGLGGRETSHDLRGGAAVTAEAAGCSLPDVCFGLGHELEDGRVGPGHSVSRYLRYTGARAVPAMRALAGWAVGAGASLPPLSMGMRAGQPLGVAATPPAPPTSGSVRGLQQRAAAWRSRSRSLAVPSTAMHAPSLWGTSLSALPACALRSVTRARQQCAAGQQQRQACLSPCPLRPGPSSRAPRGSCAVPTPCALRTARASQTGMRMRAATSCSTLSASLLACPPLCTCCAPMRTMAAQPHCPSSSCPSLSPPSRGKTCWSSCRAWGSWAERSSQPLAGSSLCVWWG